MIYKTLVLSLLVGIYIQGILEYGLIKDLHDYHFVPLVLRNDGDDELEARLHCRLLAETEDEYVLCERLRKRHQTPIIVDPRGTRSIGELVEEGQVADLVG